MAKVTNLELVNRILVATEQGRIDWQPTAQPREFTASFAGKFTIVLGQSFGGQRLISILSVKDSEGDRIVTLDSDNDERIDELHELARRQALKIDQALSELLNEIDKGEK